MDVGRLFSKSVVAHHLDSSICALCLIAVLDNRRANVYKLDIVCPILSDNGVFGLL